MIGTFVQKWGLFEILWLSKGFISLSPSEEFFFHSESAKSVIEHQSFLSRDFFVVYLKIEPVYGSPLYLHSKKSHSFLKFMLCLKFSTKTFLKECLSMFDKLEHFLAWFSPRTNHLRHGDFSFSRFFRLEKSIRLKLIFWLPACLFLNNNCTLWLTVQCFTSTVFLLWTSVG